MDRRTFLQATIAAGVTIAARPVAAATGTSIVSDGIIIDSATKTISIHPSSMKLYTVNEVHRAIQDVRDDDLTYMDTISMRHTDNMIHLIDGYTLDASLAQKVYGGTIRDKDSIWTGIAVIGSTPVDIEYPFNTEAHLLIASNYAERGVLDIAKNDNLCRQSSLFRINPVKPYFEVFTACGTGSASNYEYGMTRAEHFGGLAYIAYPQPVFAMEKRLFGTESRLRGNVYPPII